MIEIRNGCQAVSSTPELQTWVYADATTAGVTRTFFTAPPNIIPKIGDYISDTFTWVERTEYKIVPNQTTKDTEDYADPYRYRYL